MFQWHACLRFALGVVLGTGCSVYDDALLASGRARHGGGSGTDARTADASLDGHQDAAATADAEPQPDAAGTARGGAGSPGAGGAGGSDAGAAAGGSGGAGGAGGSSADEDAGTLPEPAPCTEASGVVWPDNGHCYFPLRVLNTWNVSRDRCAELDARLVTITSADEQSFIGSLVGTAPSWIGLSRFGAPAFSWVTGESMTYENWEADAPSAKTEAAVALRDGTQKWFDAEPRQTFASICERAPD